MGIFSKKDNAAPLIGTVTPISSILSKDVHIIGEVAFKGKMLIDGIVEGNILGEHLVLSECGRIKGDIVAETLLCNGTVDGNIKAKQLSLGSKATVHGRIASNSLTVETGVAIEGEIQTSNTIQSESPLAIDFQK